MKEILGPDPVNEEDRTNCGFDAHSLFADSISVFVDSGGDHNRAKGIINPLLTPRLRDFVLATDVSAKLLREVLDVHVLEEVGLTRATFAKLQIRHSTNSLYRQSNYNLLREESEGFAKLVTELYYTAHTMNQEQLTQEQVQAGFERIKGLIGTFDLDVGRVLDIVFDVFASTMMRTFRYFTMFLRVSSWWPRDQSSRYDPVLTGGLPRWALPGASFLPTIEEQAEMDEARLQRDMAFWERAREVHLDAFFELGGRHVSEAELVELSSSPNSTGQKSQPIDASEWIQTTKTIPPPGNRVAAQLYGFKLQYFISQARDKDETIPANLYFLAAYLIKIGFISLPDLYAHIWPSDDKMEDVKERRAQELEEKEKKERQGAEPNALLKAGALPDDTAPSSMPSTRTREALAPKADMSQKDAASTNSSSSEVLPEPKEVLKVDLLHHLLLVGAIPEALFVLGRINWLTDSYPEEVVAPINRILLYSIDKVYRQTLPEATDFVDIQATKKDLAQDHALPKGALKLLDRPTAKALKWPFADGTSKNVRYEHYLKEWTDNVPVCQTVDDVFTLCGTLLNISGVQIGRSTILLKKLTSIGSKSLKEDKSPQNLDRWRDLLKRILFPALNLTTSNVDIVDSVWGLLNHFPTEVRYNMYAECYEGSISRLPAMAKAFKYARLDTLAVLKRLSKENLAKAAKSMAKVALFSPGTVCKVALDQIEAYSNLIEAFVECTRYFTDLGYDVLVWSLMSSLGGKQRSRTQEGSVLLTSKWLQALSKFSGKVFRRYSNMDPTPVIQYVNEQLARGNSTDLVIMREFITSMGGIVSDVDFTDAQLAALSGGEELRRQTFINLGDKRYESGKSAARLMQALVHTRLAPRLLTNIAQYRQSAIYNLPENETHIKYLATVIDDSQQALVQFVELLRGNLAPEQFDALVPSIPRLLTEFGLDPNLAFLIGRVSLAYYLTGPGAVAVKGGKPSGVAETGADAEGDVAMDVKENSAIPTSSETPPTADDAMAVDDQESKGPTADGSNPATHGRKSDHFTEVLRPIVSTIQEILPSTLWDSISPDFFALFWSLQTSDLGIPASSYNAESLRLQKEQDFIKKDRSDMSRTGRAKAEQRKAEITQLASKLGSEATQCQERVSKTKMLLLRSASTWITTSMSQSYEAADMLIEECIIPRVLLAPGDADFCYKIIKFMHDNQVLNFNIRVLYDRLFTVNRLRSLIFGCTIREAEFLGRFIKLVLGDLSRWHKNKDIYEKEATKGGKHSAFATFSAEGEISTAVLEHGQFQDQLWSWHRNLASVLKACLQATEWLHIRNAITVLKAVLDHFPAVNFHGKQFLSVLQAIAQREAATKNDDDGQGHRVDLSVTANTAASALKKYESKWVIVQSFRPNLAGDSSDEKAVEVVKNGKATNLRASAAEFKPGPGNTRGNVTAENEDGEVTDSKAQTATGITVPTQKKDFDADQSANAQKQISLPQRGDLGKPTSRPATPPIRSSNPSPAPHGRREPSRLSTISSLPPPPGLPSRPDVPLPAHFNQDERGQIRMADPSHSRDSREPRDPRGHRETREPRDARPPESSRSRGRESLGSDRRPLEPERERHPRQDGPPRWEPPSNERESRTPRDRASSNNGAMRPTEPNRLSREPQPDNKVMPPPTQPDAQGPTVNPERARLLGIADDDTRSSSTPAEMVNPARAALINDSRPGGRSRDDSRDRNARHSSPSRRDRSDVRPQEPGREERGDRHRFDHTTPSRGPRSEPQAPSGPRGDRDQERPRDANPFVGSSSSRSDSDHAKSSQQDPNYGRLNSTPSVVETSNVPDAPRGRGRNMARGPAGPNQPPSRPDSRHQPHEQIHRNPSPDRTQPPSGPASSRARRGPMAPPPNNGPMNNAPAASSPTTGIHPDRLRHLNTGPGAVASSPQPPFPASSANSVGVHPSRLGRIEPDPPSGPAQQRHGHGHLPPIQTPERPPIPTGPGNRQPSGSLPQTPSSDRGTPMSAPTGPSASNDRSRGGSRRQLAGINNLLQGSQNPTPEVVSRNGSLRGRSSRTNLVGSDAQVLTGASPVSTPVQERSEPLGAPGSGRGGPIGDERSSRSDRDRSRRHHEHGERSSRSSRHGSRERSPGRDRNKEHREHRDRDPGANPLGNGPRDESQRRSGREPSGPGANSRGPEVVGSGRGDGVRESRHGDGRSGGRHDEHGRSGGGGRGVANSGGGMGGGPRSDEQRPNHPSGRGEDRGRNSRKRQSEEGGYTGAPSDSHKRPRHQR
ncbi:transcription factor/nuclear export subunit protein 2-domain-containing protein [Truncatella angustata]|uniref:THO complex subunit 2 n=1 Tax=Truncatella angustata TaxID=152316 RepID=A0A9P8UUQ7_9PEZI|nr:transcription factor/nuclear export subunit protein 2-domain-containing protein [Truncatella angustata]KAH6659529.1 transcription factor/nuclear export subunit protein 2-domain-containing protein [Truncatella angustata]